MKQAMWTVTWKPVRCRQPFPLTPCHRPRSCPGGRRQASGKGDDPRRCSEGRRSVENRALVEMKSGAARARRKTGGRRPRGPDPARECRDEGRVGLRSPSRRRARRLRGCAGRAFPLIETTLLFLFRALHRYEDRYALCSKDAHQARRLGQATAHRARALPRSRDHEENHEPTTTGECQDPGCAEPWLRDLGRVSSSPRCKPSIGPLSLPAARILATGTAV
jgi:hypothetical protein